jgi:hypothetical protein
MSETQGIMPHAPAHPLAAGVADAMIAQTVGEQIDQMLAKAEVERSSSASDAAAQPTGDASGVKSDVVGDLNRLIDQENQTTSAAKAPGEKTDQENAAAAEKPDVHVPPTAASETSPSDAPTPPHTASVAAPSAAPAAHPPPQPTPGITEEGVVGAASSQHSEASHAAAAPAPTAEAAPDAISEVQAADEGDESPESHEAPLPAWLKPLELLNQPFLFIPDSVRSALGKAAIVTLVNATALFIYVLGFRNHHH